MYYTFEIPKKNGSKRRISAPSIELKNIQRKLADVLSVVYDPKVCAFGFIKGRNTVENAARHANKKTVVNLDLKDFFSQIHFGRVRGMLMKAPYCIKEEAATTIAQIACLNGRLPQGAPSSPIITNMIMAPLDNALMRLAKKANCIYTRYADDITFSTFKPEFDKTIVYIEKGSVRIGKTLGTLLEKNSFEVNTQKITLRSRIYRQEVTGLTVNEFPNLRRDYIKHLRAILHSCEKYGVYNAARVYIEKGLCRNQKIVELLKEPDAEEKIVSWFKSVLVGKVHYIKQVKGNKSLTYLAFAKKTNEVLGESIFDLTYFNAFENTITNSVFILEYETGETYIQGSAFYLSGIGILTSYHVTECKAPFKVFPVNSYKSKSLGVVGKDLNEIASDMTIDYALYKPFFQINDDLTFKCGDSKNIRIGDQVTIIGYPNHQEGNSPYIQPCLVTSEKTFLGAPFFTVSGRIVHGASGGIVLNTNNEAVGIIKGGIVSYADDESNENQGFIPLHLALDHFKQSKH